MQHYNHYDDILQDITDIIIAAKDEKISSLKFLGLMEFLLIILLVAMCFCFGYRYSVLEDKFDAFTDVVEQSTAERPIEHLIGYYTLNTDTLTEYNLLMVAMESGAYYPELLVKQAKIESGLGRSNIAKNANNLFGMKCVSKRDHLQIGDYNGYGVYRTWEHSVIDRVLWDKAIFADTIPTEDEYLSTIQSIYAEDTNYLLKILNLK